MSPQLLRTVCFQGLILTSWSSLNIINVQTFGLQQMRRQAAIESAPKALLLQRQRENFVLLLVPLSYC